MRDLANDPIVVSAVALVVIAGGCAIAIYVARSFRDYTGEDHQDTQQMLANLEEMHRNGDISDEEFRVITLANQIHTTTTARKTTTTTTTATENSATERSGAERSGAERAGD